ncbi:hypothetical protein GUJ93_ZPchr0003g18560 [Zizania palustris]|uniref:Uncharacterized protein n=1 Tax=Zizania palustris TaxID=103762 RepID=A0A8J5V775_ZIZPA|nr:hypothetical protein GUJ93_ZPchr0003g18560 [Zizania palustris]
MRNSNHKLVVPITTTTSSSSSSKNNAKQEQPHLSGAYIRSLVKQLSSSSTARSKEQSTTMGTKPHGHPQPDQDQQQAPQAAPPPQPQPHKKQIRRRLHTSRPYQERLLNMAEARREIVTALKIHRASMRQAKEQQQQQQLLQLQQQQEVQVVQEQAQATRASAASMSYASFSDYLYNSPLAHFSAPTSYSSPLPYHTPVAPMVGSGHAALDHLVPLSLPAQPLGLNLSFQGFNGVVADDGKISTSSFDPPLLQPSPASSYSVYSSPTVTTVGQDMSSSVVTTENTSLAADPSLHRVLDDEEMAAIYSIGEQHDIEWSDTVNLVTSAWWSKLLDSVEGGEAGAAGETAAAGGALNAAEDDLTVTPMPDWFGNSLGHQGTKESNSDVLGMHFSDEYYHHGAGYGEDVSLPR